MRTLVEGQVIRIQGVLGEMKPLAALAVPSNAWDHEAFHIPPKVIMAAAVVQVSC